MIIKNEECIKLYFNEELEGYSGGDCWGAEARRFRNFPSVVAAIKFNLNSFFANSNKFNNLKFKPDLTRLAILIDQEFGVEIKNDHGYYGNSSKYINFSIKVNKLILLHYIFKSELLYSDEHVENFLDSEYDMDYYDDDY